MDCFTCLPKVAATVVGCFALVFAVLLTACGEKESRKEWGRPDTTATLEHLDSLENEEPLVPAAPKEEPTYTKVIRPTTSIISLTGAATEFLYRYGFGSHILAKDASSTFPPALAALPNLGPTRSLKPLNLLSLKPSLVLGLRQEMSKELVQAIEKDTSTRLIALDLAPDKQSLLNFYVQLGKELDMEQQADEVVEAIGTKLSSLPVPEKKIAVMAFIVFDRERIMVAGAGTALDAMLGFAQAQNAITAKGYQVFEQEMLFEHKPAALVFFREGLEQLGGIKGLAKLPGFATAPAVQDGAVYGLDGYDLTGFGPRTGETAEKLNKLLYSKPLQ